MTLFNGKEAVAGLSEKVRPHKSKDNPVLLAIADLKAENERLRSKLSGIDSRVASLEGFRSDQETFNAGTRERVGKLQRTGGSDALCPGCGQPASAGVHGVTCFTTVTADA